MSTFSLQARENYLSKHWMRFPDASRPNVALENLPHEGKVLTRGRIQKIDANELILASQGIQKSFAMPSDLSLGEGVLAGVCLKENDIVEALVNLEGKNGKVEGLTLLVPTKGPVLKSHSFSISESQKWQDYLDAVRSFFRSKYFIELRTPTLVPSPGLEPFLDPFETEFQNGKQSRKMYLPTSPEFHLKKALSHGFEKIFEFKECFRNGELSAHHQPEFLMLEWYRAYDTSMAIMRDCRELLSELQRKFLGKEGLPLKVLTMEELWKTHLDFELTPSSDVENLKSLAKRHKIGSSADDDFDDLFARIFLEKLEPQLAQMKEPIILWHYPPSQAALARLTPEGWADRFELYWRGLEIANAFHELNDPEEQRRRFRNDQDKKKSLGKKVVPLDQEFLQALDYGLPPSAGIALGVERLFMALFEIKEISKTRLFPMT